MAQRFFEDKITVLSESGGTITLPAGARLTIGGQQYTTTSALNVSANISSANTRYQVYAVLSGGAVQLVVSSNENSVGPAGYAAWKLIGSYYTNGLSSIGFGSFVNIVGVPRSKPISFLPVGSWTTNAIYSGKYTIDGLKVGFEIQITVSGGAPSPATEITVTVPFTLDDSLIGISGGDTPHGYCNVTDAGSIQYGSGTVNYNGSGIFRLGIDSASSPFVQRVGISTVSPFSFNDGDFLAMVIPPKAAIGFSNTPIEDL